MNQTVFRQLYELMKKKYPLFSALWLKSSEEFGEKWEAELSDNISRVFGPVYNQKWNDAVKGYAEFCTEALRAQNYFERHGRYKATSYEECVETCYNNPDYMKVRYLPGQFLSHYIWGHHRRMMQHFVNELIPVIKDRINLFFEVGVGCGLYSLKLLKNVPRVTGIGIDISNYALEFTRDVLEKHSLAHRYKTRNQDIIKNPPGEKADLVVCQEVLEHLEDPEGFIIALYDSVRPGGWGYITAAINAAHTDHIYLYRSPGEVKAQIESAGWKILDTQVEENYPEKPREFRPTIAGFFTVKSLP
jgi:SAM-dependent methyltransferase